jgi:hypothetical protein
MNHRIITLSGLLSVLVTVSAAPEPSRSIDLDVVSNSPISSIVVVRVSFAETDNRCHRTNAARSRADRFMLGRISNQGAR